MVSTRRVQPAPPAELNEPSRNSIKPPQGIHALFRAFFDTYNYVAMSWYSIQIGNRSHYSIERLLSFRDYCEQTSRTRVFFVCLLSPAPALVTMLLIDCIPLQNPDEGWRNNMTLWIRIGISSIFTSGGIVFFSKSVIKEKTISTAQGIGIAFVSSLCYTAGTMFVAAFWKFPVPFGMVWLSVPFVWLIMTFFLISIGPHALLTNSKLRGQILNYFIGVCAQSMLSVAYPTFNAVFLQLSGVEQAIFIFVLPVIKFVTKQAIAYVSTPIHDRVGVVVVFSVDVFNVLYTSICMQTAHSWITTVLVISSDIFHIVLALRTIYYHTNHIKEERGREGSINDIQLHSNHVKQILSSLEELKTKPRMRPYCGPIRLFSPHKLPLSTSSEAFLTDFVSKWNVQIMTITTTFRTPRPAFNSTTHHLEPASQLDPFRSDGNSGTSESRISSFSSRFESSKWSEYQVTPVLFSNGTLAPKLTPPKSSSHNRDISRTLSLAVHTDPKTPIKHSRKVIERTAEEGLQVLFHCEYMILAEYVECMLPLFYAGYLFGLFHLSTADYYPFTRSLSSAKMTSTLIQLIAYGLLEFGSFSGLYFIIKRRFGYSPTYQLAFVLETNAVMIQSLLFLWIMYIVPFTLVHFGVDFKAPFH